MKRQKDDAYFISKIIDDIDYILSIMDGVDLDAFSNNQMMSDSTVFRLIQISENSIFYSFTKRIPIFFHLGNAHVD